MKYYGRRGEGKEDRVSEVRNEIIGWGSLARSSRKRGESDEEYKRAREHARDELEELTGSRHVDNRSELDKSLDANDEVW